MKDQEWLRKEIVEKFKSNGEKYLVLGWNIYKCFEKFIKNNYGKKIEKFYNLEVFLDWSRDPDYIKLTNKKEVKQMMNLKSLKGSWNGKRAIVMGNGNSLKDFTPEEYLNSGCLLIGTNISFKYVKPHISLISEDVEQMMRNVEYFKELTEQDFPILYRVFQNNRNYAKEKDGMFNIQSHKFEDPGDTNIMYFHSTVASTAVHLAHYMGASEIYLVGCEGYIPGEPFHFYDRDEGDEKKQEMNGFIYQTRWKFIYEAVQRSSIKLYNAVKRSKYDFIPFKELDIKSKLVINPITMGLTQSDVSPIIISSIKNKKEIERITKQKVANVKKSKAVNK